MKKKRKKIISVGIVLLVILVVLLIIYAMTKRIEESKCITFYLLEGGSFSSGWTYELTTDNVLVEVDKEIYDCFYDRYDYWEFQPIVGTSGEVTIHFIARYELLTVEEDCFSITYYVDENGNITEISSENKPDKVNFDDDIIGLVWLKTVDRLQVFVINFVITIYDIISFMIDNKYPWLFQFHFR
ncbi:MAG: hypothetical protein IJ397_01265 [Lachnospiraceae bacterium]|nr:hypothetical protein [Lachnospiraceae bacterium]